MPGSLMARIPYEIGVMSNQQDGDARPINILGTGWNGSIPAPATTVLDRESPDGD